MSDIPQISPRDRYRILVTALALRVLVVFVLLRGMPPMFDAGEYVMEATQYLQRGWGDKALFWPPGMSLLLVPFFQVLGPGSPLAIGLVGILIGMSVVWLVMRITLEGFRDARMARIAGWLAACYPPALLLTGQPYAHAFTGALLLAACLMVIRFLDRPALPYAVLSGLALGYATLTRPSTISVVLAFGLGGVALLLIAKPRAAAGPGRLLLAVALFSVAVILPLIPAMRHNMRLGAGATISTNNGWNLFAGNNPHTPTYKTWHLAQRERSDWAPDFLALVDSLRSQPSADAAMKAYAVRHMMENPGLTLGRTVNRSKSCWGADYLGSRLVQLHHQTGLSRVAPLLLLESGSFVLLMIAAIWGIGQLAVRGWVAAATILLLTVLAYQAPYVISFAAGVYHTAVIALLFPFAAVGLARLPFRDAQVSLKNRASRLSLVGIALFLLAQLEYGFQVFRMSGD